ncbi:hypothetical protein MMEU_2315 [Mycobacterium marinum str. Europe]|nr:hypothetical protein MMEU_2315 [Mycobacterium marinum str. Europe]
MLRGDDRAEFLVAQRWSGKITDLGCASSPVVGAGTTAM